MIVYHISNQNEYFLSVDLVSANFQALNFLDPRLVHECNNYYEFISKFTDLEYFKNCKLIRQQIFGKLIPKIQLYAEKTIMRLLLNEIDKLDIFDLKIAKNLYLLQDELILRL